MMKYYLSLVGITRSALTIHRYMKELHLQSIVRRKKPVYIKDKVHKVFPNLVNREFDIKKPNQVWCTDFTYLPLSNGKMRYNCTIIDLCGREVIATLNSDKINAELAKNTLKMALNRRKPRKGVVLHSDQGSQYTSEEFTLYCEKNHVQQSMSKAGCPYDNAVMERYYNTLKNEFYNLYTFSSNESLDKALYEFAYIKYNHIRPHSTNNGLPPYVARCTT